MVAVRNHIFPCHSGPKRVNLRDHTWTAGLKLRMKSKRASQSKMAPTSHSSQKEAMRMVCSFLTLNANINLSPLIINNNIIIYTNTTYSFPRVKIVPHCSTKKESILRNDGQSRSKTKKKRLQASRTTIANVDKKWQSPLWSPRTLGLSQGFWASPRGSFPRFRSIRRLWELWVYSYTHPILKGMLVQRRPMQVTLI